MASTCNVAVCDIFLVTHTPEDSPAFGIAYHACRHTCVVVGQTHACRCTEHRWPAQALSLFSALLYCDVKAVLAWISFMPHLLDATSAALQVRGLGPGTLHPHPKI